MDQRESYNFYWKFREEWGLELSQIVLKNCKESMDTLILEFPEECNFKTQNLPWLGQEWILSGATLAVNPLIMPLHSQVLACSDFHNGIILLQLHVPVKNPSVFLLKVN